MKSYHTKSRKISFIAILLILVGVCLPILIFPIKYVLFEVKQELLAKLSPQSLELTHFELSQQEYEAMQLNTSSKEFAFDGSMYDVYKIQKDEDKIEIWAIKDQIENNIFSLFASKSVENKVANNWIGFISTFHFQTMHSPFAYNSELIELNTQRFGLRNQLPQNLYIKIFAPPPNSIILA